jgi:glycosyltransferase involved in cell wall biosynthesis
VSYITRNLDVGVVIPSRARPALLGRALESVASQTVQPREVVVVLDGADKETEAELRQRGDLPLRVIVVNPQRGASYARNVGVASLESPLVAFLDDDDEWLPWKLERQLPLMEHSDASYTRVLATGPKMSAVWPRHQMGDVHVSEYLFDRRRPWSGAGLILSSTILARTELMKSVAFDTSLRHHQDWDWALRAGQAARLAFCEDPLTIWHVDPGRRRLSTNAEWRESVDWARSRRSLFTDRAYAGFLLVNVYSIALRAKDRRAAAALVKEAREQGAPSASQWVVFAALTILSPEGTERLRFLVRRVVADLAHRNGGFDPGSVANAVRDGQLQQLRPPPGRVEDWPGGPTGGV